MHVSRLLPLFAAGLVACFPSLPPEEEDVGAGDGQVGTDVAPDAEPDLTAPDITPDTAPDTAPDTTPDVAPDTTPDVTPEDTADTTDTGPTLNACGGEGDLIGDPVGADCGPCSDGELVCDPEDPEKRRTRCEGASALNACGGCGVIDPPLEAPCDTCGVISCEPGGTGRTVCVEPSGGCETFLTCNDINCIDQSRACVDGGGTDDAVCGACLEGFVEVGGVCLRATTTPADVTATRDLADRVTITWTAAPFATGYRVFRCEKETTCQETDWTLVPNGEVATTRYDDLGTESAPEPSAPTLSASTNAVEHVDLTWAAVPNPTARAYRYRVAALAPAGETAPSGAVIGSRMTREVTGYELQLGGGAWQAIGDVLTYRDEGAPAPTLSGGTATASQGVHADYVALAVSNTGASAGTAVIYSVRAVTATGSGAASNTASGRRAAPATWTIGWERSSGTAAENFSAIPGANGPTFNDTGAPADGSARFYRAVVRAAGAITGYSPAVAGSRLPPPGVPGNVRATTDREDAVVVSWSEVPEAIGYRVYRNGTLLTTGAPITGTSYTDTNAPAPTAQWAAPTGVSATTNSTLDVTVSWTAPTRPVGADTEYAVLAVNTAGNGPLSGEVVGRRARPALVRYEVETAWSGTPASWTDTQKTDTSWVHTNAPAGVITPGTITATDGDHMAKVVLTSTGQAVNRTNVTYRVRGVLETGAHTPISSSTTGSRSVGSLTRRWQVSAQPANVNWDSLGTTATYDHSTAPADGTARYYRLALSATGVVSVNVGPVLGRRLAFVDVRTGFVFFVGTHACGRTAGGNVWCWGTQYAGALGNGVDENDEAAPVRLPGLHDVVSIGVGAGTACAVDREGAIWCWGRNHKGQVGNGSTANVLSPLRVQAVSDVVDVALGLEHTCAVIGNGSVRCWGENGNHQLGNGSTGDSFAPVSVLTSANVPLSGVSTVSSGAAATHTCATLADASVRCWGAGTAAVSTGSLGLTLSVNDGYAKRPAGNLLFQRVSTDSLTGCATSLFGEAYCWGRNTDGELGLGDTNHRFSPAQVDLGGAFAVATVETGLNWTCALSASRQNPPSTAGRVRCWGAGLSSSPGTDISSLGAAQTLSVSSDACAVVNYGVKCWRAAGSVESIDFP